MCGQALPRVFEKYNLLRFCVSEETSVCRLPRTSVCRLRRKLNPSYPTSCRQGRGSLLVSAVAPLRKAGACWSWPLMRAAARQLAFTVPSLPSFWLCTWPLVRDPIFPPPNGSQRLSKKDKCLSLCGTQDEATSSRRKVPQRQGLCRLAELVLTIVLQLWRRERNAANNMRRTACGVHDVAYSITYEGRQLTQCRIALRSSNRGGDHVQNVIERAAPTRRFWDFPRRTRPKHRY